MRKKYSIFVNCKERKKGHLKKNSYLCVKKLTKSAFKPNIKTRDGKNTDDRNASLASEDAQPREPNTKKPDDKRVPLSPKYVVRCEPNIKGHDGERTFMLFRLLKPKDKDSTGTCILYLRQLRTYLMLVVVP